MTNPSGNSKRPDATTRAKIPTNSPVESVDSKLSANGSVCASTPVKFEKPPKFKTEDNNEEKKTSNEMGLDKEKETAGITKNESSNVVNHGDAVIRA